MVTDQLVVYTAVMGGFDYLAEPKVKGRFVAFVDREMDAPGWELRVVENTLADPRTAARMIKLLPQALFEADTSIWLDANVELLVDPQMIVDEWLADQDMATFKHPHRDCIYEEAKVCIEWGKEKLHMAMSQVRRYLAEGYPKHNGLVESNVLARRHTPEIQGFNKAWWAEVQGGSVRDQLSFNYLCWKLAMKYNAVERAREHEWFKFRMIHGGKREVEMEIMEEVSAEEVIEKEPKARRRKAELPKINVVDGMIVAAPGEGIWCIDGDKRRLVPDVRTQIRMQIGMHHVVMLHPEQLEAIPKGEPMPKADPMVKR